MRGVRLTAPRTAQILSAQYIIIIIISSDVISGKYRMRQISTHSVLDAINSLAVAVVSLPRAWFNGRNLMLTSYEEYILFFSYRFTILSLPTGTQRITGGPPGKNLGFKSRRRIRTISVDVRPQLNHLEKNFRKNLPVYYPGNRVMTYLTAVSYKTISPYE